MTELREVIQELVARHGIAGAVVGVLEDGRVEADVAGIANLNSGVEMAPDTLFLTGSITNVWTHDAAHVSRREWSGGYVTAYSHMAWNDQTPKRFTQQRIRDYVATEPTVYLVAHDPETAARLAERRLIQSSATKLAA